MSTYSRTLVHAVLAIAIGLWLTSPILAQDSSDPGVPIQWIADTGLVSTNSQGGLKKTGGSNTVWDRDAVSEGSQRLVRDGKISFKVAPGSVLAVGLNLNNAGFDYQDLDFCITVKDDNTARVYHGATAGFILDNYDANTVFTIKREGTVVTYWQNGVLKHTSVHACVGTMMVDSSFLRTSPGSTSELVSAYINNGDADADELPDSWELAQFPADQFVDVAAFTPAGDADGDGLSNLQEFQDGTHPWEALSRMETVVWQNHVGTQNLTSSEGGASQDGVDDGLERRCGKRADDH